MPFPVGKYPAGDTAAKASLQSAFSNALRIGGMVVSDQTTIELIEASGSSTDAFERLQKWAERQIQIAIVGQDLSSSSAPTGLGSGVATLQGQVRDDMTAFDSQMIGQTLTDHLAKPHLSINGLRGSCKVEIGAASNLRAMGQLASVLPSIFAAGMELTDDGISTISRMLGVGLQRRPATALPGAGDRLATLSQMIREARSPDDARRRLSALCVRQP